MTLQKALIEIRLLKSQGRVEFLDKELFLKLICGHNDHFGGNPMLKAGVKEVRDKFTGYLKRVREGEEILLTERGKPIAVIKPLPKKNSLEDKLARLAAKGLVKLPLVWRPLKPRHRPIKIKGKPLSRLIIEERRKGW